MERRRPVKRLAEHLPYTFLLLSVIVTYFTLSLLPAEPWAVVVQTMAVACSVLAAYYAADVARRTLRLVALLCAAGVAAALVGALIGKEATEETIRGTSALVVLLLLFVPVAIARDLARKSMGNVTGEVVLGALSVYLVFGLLFNALYLFLDWVDGPFFVQTDSPEPNEFVYFSFVTLLTIGYGDLTPAQATGRSLVVFEGILGQVFLVTVVARLVSMFRRPAAGVVADVIADETGQDR